MLKRKKLLWKHVRDRDLCSWVWFNTSVILTSCVVVCAVDATDFWLFIPCDDVFCESGDAENRNIVVNEMISRLSSRVENRIFVCNTIGLKLLQLDCI